MIIPSFYVDQLYENRETVLGFVKEHNRNIVIAWYAWSILAYLIIRQFEWLPLRTIIHRIFALISMVTASIYGIFMLIQGILTFYALIAEQFKDLSFSSEGKLVIVFSAVATIQIMFGNLIDFNILSIFYLEKISKFVHRVRI